MESKEEQIKKFKEETPPGILKQFRDDKDIWDYLNCEGEWEADIKIKGINVTANSKEEAESIIKGMINDAINGDLNNDPSKYANKISAADKQAQIQKAHDELMKKFQEKMAKEQKNNED